MSQPSRLEIAVRRTRPDEEEPDRLPLRWATIARLLSFTEAHRGQRNALLWLCAFRAMALPLLAWIAQSPVILISGEQLSTVEYGVLQVPIFFRFTKTMCRSVTH